MQVNWLGMIYFNLRLLVSDQPLNKSQLDAPHKGIVSAFISQNDQLKQALHFRFRLESHSTLRPTSATPWARQSFEIAWTESIVLRV